MRDWKANSIVQKATQIWAGYIAPRPPVLHVACDWDVGLFNLFLGVISHTHWALSEGRIPIIYYTNRNCYWVPNGYRGGNSVWEYYFEPVIPEYPSARIPPNVVKWIADHPPSRKERGSFVDGCVFVSADGAWHITIDGEGLRGPPTNEPSSRKVREVASAIIRKYLRPRSYIIEKADRFFNEHMSGRRVIGVHIRGTDALVDTTRHVRQTQVNFPRFTATLEQLRRQNPDALILAASDAQSSVDRIRQAFGGVISYDSIRHQDGELAGRGPAGGIMPAYLTQDPEFAARNGEDAVVEYLLLCRCSYLVHNLSSIPRAVLLTMPGMAETNVDYAAPLCAASNESHDAPIRA